MSCQRLQAYFEDREDHHGFELRDGELIEHAFNCQACKQFAQSQQELANRLNLLRKSVPAVPEALNTMVLAAYRREIALPLSATATLARRWAAWTSIRWVAATAFSLLLVAALLFRTRHSTGPTPKPQAAPLAVASPSKPGGKDIVAAQRPQPGKSAVASSSRIQSKDAVGHAGNSLPPGFRSLMYCDAISCSGGMEVVRVQLPVTIMAATQTSAQQGTVSADILVGEDGLARAIRIVE